LEYVEFPTLYDAVARLNPYCDYITLNVPFVAVSNVPLQTWLF
jgi:hypothetical protein